MNQTTRLFFASLFFAVYGLVSSCQTEPSGKTGQLDSLKIEAQVRYIHQARQIDSLQRTVEDLKLWVYDVEKEQRIAEQWAKKDNDRVKAKIDSFIKTNPKDSKVARFLGTLIGEVGKRVVPGL
jgi:hypothetical protein